jgi:hypothetical protein
LHGFVLADDALVGNPVEAQKFFLLAFEEAGDGAVVFLPMIAWGKSSPASREVPFRRSGNRPRTAKSAQAAMPGVLFED